MTNSPTQEASEAAKEYARNKVPNFNNLAFDIDRSNCETHFFDGAQWQASREKAEVEKLKEDCDCYNSIITSLKSENVALSERVKELEAAIEVLTDAAQFALVHFLDKIIKPTDESEVFTTGRIQPKQALRKAGKTPLEPDILKSLKQVAGQIANLESQQHTPKSTELQSSGKGEA